MKWIQISPGERGYLTRVEAGGQFFVPCYQVPALERETRFSLDRHISRLCIEDTTLQVVALPLDANSVDLAYLDGRFRFVLIRNSLFQSERWFVENATNARRISYEQIWASVGAGVLFCTQGRAANAERQKEYSSIRFQGSLNGVTELSGEINNSIRQVHSLLGSRVRESIRVEFKSFESKTTVVPVATEPKSAHRTELIFSTKATPAVQRPFFQAMLKSVEKSQILLIPQTQAPAQLRQAAKPTQMWRSPARVLSLSPSYSHTYSQGWERDDAEPSNGDAGVPSLDAEAVQAQTHLSAATAKSAENTSQQSASPFKRPCVVFKNVALFFGDNSMTMRRVTASKGVDEDRSQVQEAQESPAEAE